MNKGLTGRECEIALWFFKKARTQERACDLLEVNLKELAKELNVNPSNLSKYLKSLQKKQVIQFGYRVDLDFYNIKCSNSL